MFDAKEARRIYLEENHTFKTILDSIKNSARNSGRSVTAYNHNPQDQDLIISELKDRGFLVNDNISSSDNQLFIQW